ncbi:MAG: hypothetical protein KDC95_07960 [Planctomycetes bacterium]|nr:hypothetical protein [Planctomycetota bacterium]
MIALVAIAIGYFWNDFRDYSRAQRKFAILGVVLAFLAPWIVFEVFWPRYFDITASKDTIDYEFASPDYANAFAVANGIPIDAAHE